MDNGTLTDRQQVVAVVLVAAVVGVGLSPLVLEATDGTAKTVAVVEIGGPIISSTADSIEQELRDVRQNDSVEAVVLKMNTPGGEPAASERIYMSVQRTAEEMPVVASVQRVSASGGYYAMLPAETIYVMPTSQTGSVGLAAAAPQPAPPVRGPSGPNKRGSTVVGQWALQETLADTFINTVMAQRGDEIEVSRAEVAHAKVYLGTEAVRNGFADEIGSLNEAIREAADRAGLEDYRVSTRNPGPESSVPTLVRTDTQILVVRGNDPGYGEVRPLGVAYVHEAAVPHIDTVERVSQADIDGTSGEENAPPAGPTDDRTVGTQRGTAGSVGGEGA